MNLSPGEKIILLYDELQKDHAFAVKFQMNREPELRAQIEKLRKRIVIAIDIAETWT